MAKNQENKIAGFMSKYLAAAQQKFGKDIYVGPEHKESHYGIKIPNLALQYLLTSTVIPMGRIICFSGAPKSGKSTLGYEFLRMVMEHPGLGTLIETEFKTSNPLLESILNEQYTNLIYNQAKSLDEAQDMITFGLDYYTKEGSSDIPMGMLLDSVSGTKSEELQDKINAVGHAEKAFPKEALMNTYYFATLSEKLMNKPIMFIFINHEKEEIDGHMGIPGTRNPGGDALEFHSTYHIRVQRIGSIESKQEGNGNILKLKTKKNSMGEDNRSIVLEYRWLTYEEDGQTKQKTMFDWNKATAELLAGTEIPRQSVSEVLTVVKKNRNEFSCKELDFKNGPPSELGALINANEQIMSALRPKLGIFKWKEL